MRKDGIGMNSYPPVNLDPRAKEWIGENPLREVPTVGSITQEQRDELVKEVKRYFPDAKIPIRASTILALLSTLTRTEQERDALSRQLATTAQELLRVSGERDKHAAAVERLLQEARMCHGDPESCIGCKLETSIECESYHRLKENAYAPAPVPPAQDEPGDANTEEGE